jgi:hypothetical protein
MDFVSITSAYQGLMAVKELLNVAFEAKVDVEAKPKIIEALQKLGDAQDTLFALRDELFKLQDTNQMLRKQLDESESWKEKADQYELIKTAGDAVVYKSKGQPEHFACPRCFSSKSIQVLQTNHSSSGKYSCPDCRSEYPVEPRKEVPPVQIRWP